MTTRRAWLASLPGVATLQALALARPRWEAALPLGAASQTAPIRAVRLQQVTLAVSDVARSVAFYQGLFGCPVRARHGSTVLLGIGGGPRFLALADAGGAPPRFRSFGIAVEGFDAERVAAALVERGLERVTPPTAALPGPMQVVVRTRGDTPELFFGDPHGLVVQLQDPRYCGGSGPLGDRCATEASSTMGGLSLLGISHLTNVSDPATANDFYRATLGLDVQTYQAASPLLGVGPGDDFLMFIGGPQGRAADGAARRPGAVHHACFTVAGFSVEGVQRVLEAHGVRPREDTDAAPPRHWVSMRMPDRGGAPEGTPELYFSDPDGLSIQLQDRTYCGGGGRLGEICG